MIALFDLHRTSEAEPAIDAWWSAKPPVLSALARRWWDIMRACGEDVREALHDGQPTACIDVYPFAYVDAFTAHVNVGFFYGASLPDPAGILVGKGKRMRHVKLVPNTPHDEPALEALIHQAYDDLRRRLDPP